MAIGRAVWWIGGAVLGGAVLAGAVWHPDVRFVVEKMATFAVMPYNVVAFLLLVLVWRSWHNEDRRGAALSLVALLLQIGFGNGYVATFLMGTLEANYGDCRPLADSDCEVIVVLGGGTTEGRNGVPQANWAGDRVLLAARLYHQGHVQKIYCTGNRVQSLSHDKLDPWEEASRILQELGVPASAIEHLDGRNTSEEMQSLSQAVPRDRQVGIVTSAYHMSRALRLAQQNQIHAVPLPCDFYTEAELAFNPIVLVPTANAGYVCQTALREYLARLVRR